MTRILVTGGAGFIGSHVVDLLVQHGHSVSVVDNMATGKLSNVNERAKLYRVDICGAEFADVVKRERPEVVLHQAAQISVKTSTDDPVFDARVNVLGLLNVLEACTSAGVHRIVFASSGATYGNPERLPFNELHAQRPESPYGITKLAGEQYLAYFERQYGLSYAALRYGNVYGPRQDAFGEAGVVAIFTRQLLAGECPTIHWDGEQIRDYVYVSDVARANLAAATATASGCYCIGTGLGTSVNRLYALLCETIGLEVTPKRGQRRPGDLRAAYFDCRRARATLDWSPRIHLADGLAQTVAWFKCQNTVGSTTS